MVPGTTVPFTASPTPPPPPPPTSTSTSISSASSSSSALSSVCPISLARELYTAISEIWEELPLLTLTDLRNIFIRDMDSHANTICPDPNRRQRSHCDHHPHKPPRHV